VNVITHVHVPQSGFTLLEALVAIVVISTGLLGLLGLQTVAVVNSQTSQFRTFASIGADDIADRIRANAEGAKSGHYTTIAASPKPNRLCTKAICSPQEMAAVDAWEWNDALDQTLPNGQGFVDCLEPSSPVHADPCRVYLITVAWSERLAGGTHQSAGLASCNSSKHSSLESQCFTTEVRP